MGIPVHRALCALVLSALFFSCSSVADRRATPRETFVDTHVSMDGRVYTSCVFSHITAVSRLAPAESANSANPAEQTAVVPGDQYEYHPETSEIVFAEAVEPGARFRVQGEYAAPPTFVLNNAADEPPFVLAEGRVLQSGRDFRFDRESATLAFLSDLDLDASSYAVCWQHDNAAVTVLSNRLDKYAEFYRTQILIWFRRTRGTE